MDHTVLKKKLSTFKTSKGNLIKVSDEVLLEVIRSWESWTGTSRQLGKELGINMKQVGFLVRKAKKLLREGHVPELEFKEIKDDSVNAVGSSNIEKCWDSRRIIRFKEDDQLVDFLKKAS